MFWAGVGGSYSIGSSGRVRFGIPDGFLIMSCDAVSYMSNTHF